MVSAFLILFLSAATSPTAAAAAEVDETGAPSKLGGEGESCLASRDCGESLECRQNVCVFPGTFTSCERSSDCGSPLKCKANVCVGPNTPLPKAAAPSAAPVVVAPSGPYYFDEMPYREGMPIPPGMKVVERTRVGLWASGLSLFATSYILAGVFGTLGLGSPLTWLPVFGSFFGAALVPSFGVGGTLATQIPLGIVQVAGAAMLISGLAAKKKLLVLDRFTMEIEPSFTPQFQGLSISGQF